MQFKAALVDQKWKISSSPNHSLQHLRSILQLFALDKLTNHFLEVKSNAVQYRNKIPTLLKILVYLDVSTVIDHNEKIAWKSNHDKFLNTLYMR